LGKAQDRDSVSYKEIGVSVTQDAKGAGPLRLTALLATGTVLSVLNAVWMIYMETLWNQGYSTLISLYYNAVFTLVLLVLGNGLLRRLRLPNFSRTELLVLFIMSSVATGVASMSAYMTSVMAFPFNYAAKDPRWASSLQPYLNQWTAISDPEALKRFYEGGGSILDLRLLRPWILPVVVWGVFVLAMVWTGLCLSALSYNRWRHEEKLSFPLTQIPLMITETRERFWTTPLFWVGFSIAAGIDILNAISTLYPSVPGLWVKMAHFIAPGLSSPWSALSPVLYSYNPCLLGLEYFLPLDLLFSIPAFYWFARLQGVVAQSLGYPAVSSTEQIGPYVREQSLGAMLAMLAVSLYLTRGRWKDSWREAPMFLSLNVSSVGAVIGMAAMVGVLWTAGLPLGLAFLFVGVLVAVAFSLARIRAQYGPVGVGLLTTAPGPALYGILGTQNIGLAGLVGLSTTHWIGREFAGNPIQFCPEGMRLTEDMRPRYLIAVAIMLAALVGYLSGFGTVLSTGYWLGHGTAQGGITQWYFGNEAYASFFSRLGNQTRGPHLDTIAAISVGAAVTGVLQALRTRYVGFALNPVGYAMSGTYIATYVWSTCAVIWLVKLLVMRYAGLKGYYRFAPFFLGLVLGEFIIGSLLSAASVVVGVRMYVFWPY